MGSLQGKPCVSFVHEFFGCPQVCRSVATLTLGLSSLLELPSVYVLMAGRTFSWCGAIAPALLARHLIDRPFNVTVFAGCLSMSPDEGKTSLSLVSIRTELKGRVIRQMAHRAVALLQFPLELPSVGISMACLTCLVCGSELPHLGICINAMALDAGHSPVCTQQGIGFTMLGRSQGCGHKSIRMVAFQARAMTVLELPSMGV
jgi:hypothetical protein